MPFLNHGAKISLYYKYVCTMSTCLFQLGITFSHSLISEAKHEHAATNQQFPRTPWFRSVVLTPFTTRWGLSQISCLGGGGERRGREREGGNRRGEGWKDREKERGREEGDVDGSGTGRGRGGENEGGRERERNGEQKVTVGM